MPLMGVLLGRGMLAGLVAALLCFGFLRLYGEPAVDRAIAFGAQMDAAKAGAEAKAGMPEMTEPELVSRPVQAGLGLFTGVGVYGAACGGLFALVFAALHGRIGGLRPRALAALLAAAAFVTVYLVPSLKYPANPPSVGDPETIGWRTALYFTEIGVSLAAMIGAALLRRRAEQRFGAWNAALVAAAAYGVVMIAMGLLLPAVDEVPAEFPATVLWQFRTASIGSHLLMWTVIGLLFGAMAERVLGARRLGARPLHLA